MEGGEEGRGGRGRRGEEGGGEEAWVPSCPENYTGSVAGPACVSYATCDAGEYVVGSTSTCGIGTLYNKMLGVCDHEYNVVCYVSGGSSSSGGGEGEEEEGGVVEGGGGEGEGEEGGGEGGVDRQHRVPRRRRSSIPRRPRRTRPSSDNTPPDPPTRTSNSRMRSTTHRTTWTPVCSSPTRSQTTDPTCGVRANNTDTTA